MSAETALTDPQALLDAYYRAARYVVCDTSNDIADDMRALETEVTAYAQRNGLTTEYIDPEEWAEL